VNLYWPVSIGEVQLIVNWVNERLPEPDDFNNPLAVAVMHPDKPGKIIAGAIYSSYGNGNVFFSGAIDPEGIGKMTRGDFAGIVGAPFAPPLNCRRITALVSESNKRSQSLVERLGFLHEGNLREYLKEGEVTRIYGMTREDFLGGKYGKQRRRREAA